MDNKVKYVIGVAVIAGVLLVGLNVLTSGKVRLSASVARAVQPAHNIGDVDIFGGEVVTGFTLQNEGVEDLRILSGRTDCACMVGEIDGRAFGVGGAYFDDLAISPGEEKTLAVIFDPLAYGHVNVGQVTRILLLETDSRTTPKVTVSFTANVIDGENNEYQEIHI